MKEFRVVIPRAASDWTGYKTMRLWRNSDLPFSQVMNLFDETYLSFFLARLKASFKFFLLLFLRKATRAITRQETFNKRSHGILHADKT